LSIAKMLAFFENILIRGFIFLLKTSIRLYFEKSIYVNFFKI